MSILIDGTSGITPLAFSSNLQFTSTGQRILGDFSNATIANRVMFQTSTASSRTQVGILPNGSGTEGRALLNLYNTTDPANSSVSVLYVDSTTSAFLADKNGTGTYLPMTFYTGGSERMRIDTSGNVGFGTNSPAYRLDVNGTATRVTNGTRSLFSWIDSGGSGVWDTASEAGQGVYFSTASSYTAIYTNSAERMRINSSGYVGIGTSNPSQKLVVSNAGAQGIEFSPDAVASSPAIVCYNRSGAAYVQLTTSALKHVWFLGGTQGMTLDESNRLGIGVTPNVQLDVGGTSQPIIRAISSSTNNASARMFSDGDTVYFGSQNTSTSGGNVPVVFQSSGTERMRITDVGEVWIAGTTDRGAYNLQCNGTGVWGAGAYTNGSDQRLKENITTLDNSLGLVNAMRPVTFTYKEDYSKDRAVQPGFIAQELQEVLSGKDYLDGIVQAGPEYLNVAYQNLIPLLVKSIQELTARVEELENK